MYFTKEKIANFEEGAKKEWLLTNGIGSFAAGSLNGSNTRRYHGLLVAASSPPVDRHVVVSNVHESFEINGKKYSLATFECAGGYKEDGFDYLTGFQNNFLPTWHYKINDILLTKQIWMVYGKNTTVITYRIKNGEKNILLTSHASGEDGYIEIDTVANYEQSRFPYEVDISKESFKFDKLCFLENGLIEGIRFCADGVFLFVFAAVHNLVLTKSRYDLFEEIEMLLPETEAELKIRKIN